MDDTDFNIKIGKIRDKGEKIDIVGEEKKVREGDKVDKV